MGDQESEYETRKKTKNKNLYPFPLVSLLQRAEIFLVWTVHSHLPPRSESISCKAQQKGCSDPEGVGEQGVLSYNGSSLEGKGLLGEQNLRSLSGPAIP